MVAPISLSTEGAPRAGDGRFEAIDSLVERLALRAGPFARLSLAERVALVEAVRRDYGATLDGAVRAGCVAKGIDPDSPTAGEEWLAHAYPVMRHLRLLSETLRSLQKTGSVGHAASLGTLPSGRLARRVFPLTALDRLSFP